MELLNSRIRSGLVSANLVTVIDQTLITVAVIPDPIDLSSRGNDINLAVRIEQSLDNGVTWCYLGGFTNTDVKTAMSSAGRNGLVPTSLWIRLTCQVYRDDIYEQFLWPIRREIRTTTKRMYYQLQLMPLVRVSVDTYTAEQGVRTGDTSLRYSVDVVTGDRDPSAMPFGTNSASLIGTFPGAEINSGTQVDSGTLTTTSGSLIVAVGSSWDSGGGQNNTITDSKSNSWTEQAELPFGSGNHAKITVAYNNAGTRGTTHSLTNTRDGISNAQCVGGAEFDGILTPINVSSNTATGTTTPMTVTLNPAGNRVYLGVAGYDNGTSTTITPNAGGDGWAQIQEVDENNDAQSFNFQYKAGSSGSQTAQWTLGSSPVSGWGAIIVAFEESTTGPRFILGNH